ncbi:MAG: hypothetical protein ACREU7_12080, partial [Burkholderiales bacterium]
MNQKLQAADAQMRCRIDALVCGELAEEERRDLLAWLDADASRWRMCGLAFLEAQLWERALDGENTAESDQRSVVGGQRSEVKRQWPGARTRNWTMPLIAIAASIAAFVCGVLFQEMRIGPHE